MSNVQIVHQLLSQMGIKIAFRWSESGKDKQQIYHLNIEWRGILRDVIEQRYAERESLVKTQVKDSDGSPMTIIEELEQTGNLLDDDQARSSRYPQGVNSG